MMRALISFSLRYWISLLADEEITRRYYRELEPSIGRTYRLRYDNAEARTIVEPGYFAEQELA